jgi:competence protein ComEC
MTKGYLILEVHRIDGVRLKRPFLARAYIYGVIIPLQIGDTVELKGKLQRPSRPTNPGQFDYARYLAIRNIHALISIDRRTSVKVTQGSGLNINRLIGGIRERLREVLKQKLGPDSSAYMASTILGFREGLSDELYLKFQRTGTAHLLAISGLHLALITALVWGILRLISLSIRIRYLLLISCASLYTLLTGCAPSVLRAFTMVLLYLLADLIGRRRSGINAIAFSALLILMIEPLWLFDLGFQLSYTSVISIMLISPIFYNFSQDQRLSWLSAYIFAGLAVSLSAWLATAPMIARYFNLVTPCVLVANLIIVPVVSIMLGMGVLLLLLYFLCEPLTFIPAAFTEIGFNIVKFVSEGLSFIPFSYFYIPTPPVWYVLLLFILLGCWAIWCWGHKRSYKPLFIMPYIMLLPLPIFFQLPVRGLMVSMLDVGKGQSIYIQDKHGRTILYDAGSSTYRDVSRSVIAPFLFYRGIRHLDYLILSHTDQDHINGVKSLVEMIQIENLVVTRYFRRDKRGAELIDWIRKRGIHIKIVERIGDSALELAPGLYILAPPTWERLGQDPSVNDTSIVLVIQQGDIRVMLTGDMQRMEMAELLDSGIRLSCDILQAPHHAKLEEHFDIFAERVRPRFLLVSSPPDAYSQLVVNYYQGLGTKVYITGDSGAIILSSEDHQINILDR